MDEALTIHRSTFDELSARDLYDLLRVRSAVFVVEQECVFLDLDGRDHEPTAEHLWIRDAGGILATLRVLDEGEGVGSIGRVVTRPDARGHGHAAQLMNEALEILDLRGCTAVDIGAQAHLADWYESFGFEISGPAYDEDGILHLPMRRPRP